jgi:hypothetical protein
MPRKCSAGIGQRRTKREQGHCALTATSLDRVIGDRSISQSLFSMEDLQGARCHADSMVTHSVIPVVDSTSSVRFRLGRSVVSRVLSAQLL